jgi:hypothetical protein
VIDNTNYHSLIVDKTRASKANKVGTVTWLFGENIQCDSDQARAKLLGLVRLAVPKIVQFGLDDKTHSRSNCCETSAVPLSV